MKQNSNSSDPITKGFLRTELKRELNSTIDRLLQGIHREITFVVETVSEKFEQKLSKHTSLILTTVDPLLKELETRRQDRELASNQTARIKNQIDNHEKRIKKLEQIQQIA